MLKIIILLSSYNGEKYIEKQIDSILALDKYYRSVDGSVCLFEIELLVRDDGSTDRTIEILSRYKEKGLLDFYSGLNKGISQSFFDLMFHSPRADYYAFSDQDDFWLPGKISKAISVLEDGDKNTIKLYGSNAKLVDKNLKSMNKFFYPKVFCPEFKLVSCSCGLLGCTMIFNDQLMSLFRENKLPRKVIMHDYYITLLCCACNGQVVFDNSSEILYRQHGKNVCGASINIVNKIKNHLRVLNTEPVISIADQAKEILDNYAQNIDEDKTNWLTRISQYRKSFLSRLSLALSKKFHFYSYKRAFAMRLHLLMGKM